MSPGGTSVFHFKIFMEFYKINSLREEYQILYTRIILLRDAKDKRNQINYTKASRQSK